tara:strand:+ start:18293 stop:18496 length:204 start_codon:yes stop_codon:yes gene_type:complete
MKVGIQGRNDLVRDTSSMAIINTDSSALEKARMKQIEAQNKVNEFQQLKDDVAELKQMMKEVLKKWQ